MIYTNNYGKYFIPKCQLHRPVANVVTNGGVWEEDTLNFIKDNCKNQSIVHAGAYFGDFLPALSSFTEGFIYAYEAHPSHCNWAISNIKINNLKNVSCENIALSNSPGMCNLELIGYRKDNAPNTAAEDQEVTLGGASRIILNKSQTSIRCQRDALDNLLISDEQISIIHLDIEGHEIPAILGAKNLIKKNKPILIIENQPRYKQNRFKQVLESLRYKFTHHVDNNSIFSYV